MAQIILLCDKRADILLADNNSYYICYHRNHYMPSQVINTYKTYLDAAVVAAKSYVILISNFQSLTCSHSRKNKHFCFSLLNKDSFIFAFTEARLCPTFRHVNRIDAFSSAIFFIKQLSDLPINVSIKEEHSSFYISITEISLLRCTYTNAGDLCDSIRIYRLRKQEIISGSIPPTLSTAKEAEEYGTSIKEMFESAVIPNNIPIIPDIDYSAFKYSEDIKIINKRKPKNKLTPKKEKYHHIPSFLTNDTRYDHDD